MRSGIEVDDGVASSASTHGYQPSSGVVNVSIRTKDTALIVFVCSGFESSHREMSSTAVSTLTELIGMCMFCH
jgi:hypothetical protein